MTYIAFKSINMEQQYKVMQDYRDRWSTLPAGEHELKAGDLVTIFSRPGIGSIGVRKQDGTEVWVAGFSGYILEPVGRAKS